MCFEVGTIPPNILLSHALAHQVAHQLTSRLLNSSVPWHAVIMSGMLSCCHASNRLCQTQTLLLFLQIGHERNGYRTDGGIALDVRHFFQPDGRDLPFLPV